MSEKNREGKRTAREQLREQREREKAAEKRGRVLKVSAAIVGVLAVAAVVGVVAANQGGGGGGEDEGSASAKPISVGQKKAPAELTVYEDFRCPACGQFENVFRDTLHSLEEDGKLKVNYHIVSIIDGAMGGSGSKNAANAAVCARDEGRFKEYHDVLFRHQPEEQDDAFANKKTLIGLAKKVDGLDGAAFRSCVNDGKHDKWVERSTTAFQNSGHQGTPTVLLDGKNLYGDQSDPLTPQKLKKKIEAKS
ncbi:DsbA family protein [Streptomyces sp. NPDC054796]